MKSTRSSFTEYLKVGTEGSCLHLSSDSSIKSLLYLYSCSMKQIHVSSQKPSKHRDSHPTKQNVKALFTVYLRSVYPAALA